VSDASWEARVPPPLQFLAAPLFLLSHRAFSQKTKGQEEERAERIDGDISGFLVLRKYLGECPGRN
jgi:hypothetical protein